jgi:uncharacterized protein involved in cysteine biosynthesis
MIAHLSSKLIVGVAVAAGLLWTLLLAVTYALLAATDDVTRWLTTRFPVDPDWARWLSSAGVWLADIGGWVVLVVWALGVAAIALATGFARRVAQHFSGIRREGELT